VLGLAQALAPSSLEIQPLGSSSKDSSPAYARLAHAMLLALGGLPRLKPGFKVLHLVRGYLLELALEVTPGSWELQGP
jgi:hypothetical protein